MTEARYLLDTNMCIYLLEGRSGAVRRRLEACTRGSVVTSAIVQAEVLIGIHDPEEFGRAEQFFAIVEALPFDNSASRAYARLPFRRASFDRLIAAHAWALGLILVTNNERDFAGVNGLAVENWTR